jgi:glycosyltransferase involved in cell wall biosynthesis
MIIPRGLSPARAHRMLQLGFVCEWERRPEATWSHTPWMLRASLREICEVRDIDLTFPELPRKVLRLAYARRRNGRISSLWKHGIPAQSINAIRLSRTDRSIDVDAVLEIGDIGATRSPFFILQDLSYDLLLEVSDDAAINHQFPTLSKKRIAALRDRQRALYEKAEGIIALSDWFGRSLTSLSGVPHEKVHVVYPGSTSIGAPSEAASIRRWEGPRRRLLFVGRDFARKGGAETVAALAMLRRDVDPTIQLTIAGPAKWPMDGGVPDGVNFVGNVPPEQVSALYDEHDVFVLPSKFEAFGIVFVEALSRGLPCIARNDFAMPELVHPGVNGALVNSESPDELATAIAGLLVDDAVFAETQRRSADAAAFYTWRRAAEQTVAAIESHV